MKWARGFRHSVELPLRWALRLPGWAAGPLRCAAHALRGAVVLSECALAPLQCALTPPNRARALRNSAPTPRCRASRSVGCALGTTECAQVSTGCARVSTGCAQVPTVSAPLSHQSPRLLPWARSHTTLPTAGTTGLNAQTAHPSAARRFHTSSPKNDDCRSGMTKYLPFRPFR